MLKGKVCIVIPSHNGWEFTRACLFSISKSDYKNIDIIVIDDGSTDSSSENIYREFPNVHVLFGDGNLWWSGSMNLGICEAIKNQAEYILVLNNDVIISPDTISMLMECANENPNAIIGSMIYNIKKPDLIWGAGGIIKWPWPGEIQIGYGELDHGQYNGIRKVSWTPGMGTLIKCKILSNLNFYDNKNMPQYIADIDFCLRASREGYPVIITSKSKIFNNTENTGGIKTINKIGWNDFWEMFTSLRSPDYLRARLTFILQHCQWYFILPAILIRYFRLTFFILRR